MATPVAPNAEQIAYGIELAKLCIQFAQNHQRFITAMQLRTAVATIFGPEVDTEMARLFAAHTPSAAAGAPQETSNGDEEGSEESGKESGD